MSIRKVDKVKEGPPGFYSITLRPSKLFPKLPPGHYVFGVAVTDSRVREGATPHYGQSLAVGDMPE